jgi:hypothetical protein
MKPDVDEAEERFKNGLKLAPGSELTFLIMDGVNSLLSGGSGSIASHLPDCSPNKCLRGANEPLDVPDVAMERQCFIQLLRTVPQI